MTETAILQVLSTTGAAAALLYVLYQLISGKLHTNSEMDGLKEVISKLETMNRTVVDQLKQTNEIFERAIQQGYAARKDVRGPYDER